MILEWDWIKFWSSHTKVVGRRQSGFGLVERLRECGYREVAERNIDTGDACQWVDEADKKKKPRIQTINLFTNVNILFQRVISHYYSYQYINIYFYLLQYRH